MIPAWLQRTLAGRHHRAAALRLCTKCKAPVIVGLDADHCALTAECDPIPLTPLGEAIALITGRRTYTLTPGPDRKELDYRDEWRIQTPTKNPILAQHKCGAVNLAPFAHQPPRKSAEPEVNGVPF